MTDKEITSIKRQIQRLPDELDRARKKVEALENKARRFGLHELINNQEVSNHG